MLSPGREERAPYQRLSGVRHRGRAAPRGRFNPRVAGVLWGAVAVVNTRPEPSIWREVAQHHADSSHDERSRRVVMCDQVLAHDW